MFKEFIVETEYEGCRLDKFLGELSNISRSQCKKAIEEGRVTINGNISGKADSKLKVALGDKISIEVEEESPILLIPEAMELEVIYEDEDLLVVNKPRGMVVHPGVGNVNGTLVNGLLSHCNSKLSYLAGNDRPGIVHRIDKDTSGLLVVAKSDEAYEGLKAQFQVHSITRKYMAIVHHNFKELEGTIVKDLARDKKNPMKRVAVEIGNGKRAVTHYKVLESFGDYTLISCELETGRTHQIRAHMAYIRHNLVGDPLYGIKKDRLYQDGQLLHAGTIGFIHPITNEYMEFSVEPPEIFEKILIRLRGGK